MSDVATANSDSDLRGWRVAVVADAVLNSPAGSSAPSIPQQALDDTGYGLLQLPPADVPGNPGLLLAVIADQIAEYAHHGYAIVAIGWKGLPGDGLHWRRLSPLLRRRGVIALPRCAYDPRSDPAAEQRDLTAFLAEYDLPEEERRRWRV